MGVDRKSQQKESINVNILPLQTPILWIFKQTQERFAMSTIETNLTRAAFMTHAVEARKSFAMFGRSDEDLHTTGNHNQTSLNVK